MVELFTYKLLQNYISEYLPEIKWIDVFTDQYNDDKEERPFRSLSCFIEFQPRVDITTTQLYRNDGALKVNLHLVMPRSDNYTIRKKNVTDTFYLQNEASKLNKYVNVLDSSEYPQNSVYRDHMLIEASTAYNLGRSHLDMVEHKYNNMFQTIVLTYTFNYSDKSSLISTDFMTGWTFDVILTPLEQLGQFSVDFNGTNYDVRNEINYIWFEKINISGTTLTITGHSFKDGIPIDLEYGISTNDVDLPIYTTSNTFVVIPGAQYWVYMRDTLGTGCVFPTNPITA